MKAKIIDIGNSKGIRLPKSLLEQLGLKGEVLLSASKGALIIKPLIAPRFDWAASFRSMASAGDDRLVDLHSSSSWDDQEWEWK